MTHVGLRKHSFQTEGPSICLIDASVATHVFVDTYFMVRERTKILIGLSLRPTIEFAIRGEIRREEH